MEIKIVTSLRKHIENGIDLFPRSFNGPLILVSLFQQVDFVLQFTKDLEVLGEDFACRIKWRNDNFLGAHANFLSCH